ncbi:diacylglycerol kinase family protein [Bacillus sp. B15-48]|uniref:diacylglycerol kinase family protein n=1 Tax=Bacillus sp. B15-48 TaxID=1548601 RepID=UPI00193F45FC|nr:diacylglycerol kinase family protein [Bacillus sp. B15-48]MBM4762331.1 diacylglycerol kinase family protein [Bacillus sp. B15-48]
MSMDSRDNNKFKRGSIIHSFRFAFSGIVIAVKKERNLKIHIAIAGLVLFAGFLLEVSVTEWLIIFLCIGCMLTAEMLNSAVERVVDLRTKDYHPLAKEAKDIAAGAVLVFAITAAIIGVIIFGPKLLNVFV